MPGGERSIKGCIVKDSHGGYLLVPQRGEKVRLNSSGDIANHEGQEVKVSGAFVDAPEPSDPAPGQKAPVVREFRVVKVDVLSTTCTLPAGKKKK